MKSMDISKVPQIPAVCRNSNGTTTAPTRPGSVIVLDGGFDCNDRYEGDRKSVV